jgi:hypothetical protein
MVSLSKKIDRNVGFQEKHQFFSAENWGKSLKIVIETSTADF